MIFGFAFVPTDSQPAEMVCILTLFASVFSAFIVSGHSVMLDYNHNVINVANFAMDVHNRMNSYPYAFKVVDIISDAAQVSVFVIYCITYFCSNLMYLM